MTEDDPNANGGADTTEGADASGGADADDLFDDESIDATDEVDDPFAKLGGGASEGDASERDASAGDAPGSDAPRDAPGEPVPESETGTEDSLFGGGNTDRDREDPFDELGPSTGETDADLADAFERMDVGGVSEEDVWESLDEDADGEFGPVGEFGGAAAGADATGSGRGSGFAGGDVERVVSKRTYCQQCPHFSAPPATECGHEGTTILEAVGFDEFRVRNCPMINDDDPTLDESRGE